MALAIPTTTAPTDLVTLEVRALLPWLVFGTLLAMSIVFFITAAISLPAGTAIHEWVHDGRHLLGYPCH